MDYPSETSLCTVAPSPTCTDTPSPNFSEAAVHRLSQTDNPSSNCPSKLMDNFMRVVHSKLKLFHFKLRHITYPARIIKRITISVKNECRTQAFSWAFACLLLIFHKSKIIFKLTIDISMCKVEYFIKSMIYQMLKFFKRIAYFIPRCSEDLYFALKIQKIQVN